MKSPSAPRLSVVVPVFNEEDNVGRVRGEIQSALEPTGISYEIIFVDDGSTDRTAERITPGSGVRLIRFEENTGQSAATHAGLNAAHGAIIALIDGDLQNDPADLPALVEEMERRGVDLMCGYRARRRDTLTKRLTSRLANFVRSRFTQDGVRDTGCSLKTMRRECVKALVPFRGMHRFLPALIKGAGFRIAEMPVNHRPRSAGMSKYGLCNRALAATMDMFGVRWLISRHFCVRQHEVPPGAAQTPEN